MHGGKVAQHRCSPNAGRREASRHYWAVEGHRTGHQEVYKLQGAMLAELKTMNQLSNENRIDLKSRVKVLKAREKRKADKNLVNAFDEARI